MSTGAELVALLVVPSLPMVPPKLVQLPGFRLVFCRNVQFAQMDGQDTMTLLPERLRVSRGRKVEALVNTSGAGLNGVSEENARRGKVEG